MDLFDPELDFLIHFFLVLEMNKETSLKSVSGLSNTKQLMHRSSPATFVLLLKRIKNIGFK